MKVAQKALQELSALLSFSNKQPPVCKAKNMSCFIWSLNTGLTVHIFYFRLEEINLSKNQLETVCPQLFQIESLKYLNLSHNKIQILFRSRHQMGEWQLDRGSIQSRHCKLVTMVTQTVVLGAE